MDVIVIDSEDGVRRWVNLANIVDARMYDDGRLKLFTTAPGERGVVVFEGPEAEAVAAALSERAQTVTMA